MHRLILIGLVVAAILVAGISTAGAQGIGPIDLINCGAAPTPRLVGGQDGRVTPGLPNLIRSLPRRGVGSAILGQIPALATFTVLPGYAPQCGDGMYWYYVNFNGVVGWTPEGSNTGAYWTEPASFASDCPPLGPRLVTGGQGRVLPGLPNVIRSQPFRGTGSQILGSIPAGGTFHVVGGSACGSGIRWWQVNYNGIVGWTGESQGTTYWLEPTVGGTPSCGDVFEPNLTLNATGFVPDGISVTQFTQPSAASAQITELPGGALFYVFNGPVCAEGMNWWQVLYNGNLGWVIEATSTTYLIRTMYCDGFQPSRLLPGTNARVLPGLPNNVRVHPAQTATRVGEIPAGGIVSVLDGPRCNNNGAWWQVNYNGLVGWTMEGRSGEYWMDAAFEG